MELVVVMERRIVRTRIVVLTSADYDDGSTRIGVYDTGDVGPHGRARLGAADVRNGIIPSMTVNGPFTGMTWVENEPERHDVCTYQWNTTGARSFLHSCSSASGHDMEHRCLCGALFPS